MTLLEGKLHFLHTPAFRIVEIPIENLSSSRLVLTLLTAMYCRLSYLHSQKIVHRDVKTENMLLDKTRTVKIADFGVARVEASNPNDMTGETGTLGYMAPEVRLHGTLKKF